MTDRLKEIKKRIESPPSGSVMNYWGQMREDIPFLLSEIERVTAERDDWKGRAENERAQGLMTATEFNRLLAERDGAAKGFEQWKKQYTHEWGARQLVEKERDRLREALEVARTAIKFAIEKWADDYDSLSIEMGMSGLTWEESEEFKVLNEDLAEIARIESGGSSEKIGSPR